MLHPNTMEVMKKKLWSMLAIMMAATVGFNLSSCGDDEDNGPSNPQSNIHYYEADSNEDYTPLLLGKWYCMEIDQRDVYIEILTFNSDATWSKIGKARLSDDNYAETIPAGDVMGTFTLESNNIIAKSSGSGNIYATWNFSPTALRQDTLKIMFKEKDYTSDADVERMELVRYNYASPDEALDQYIAQHHLKK